MTNKLEIAYILFILLIIIFFALFIYCCYGLYRVKECQTLGFQSKSCDKWKDF